MKGKMDTDLMVCIAILILFGIICFSGVSYTIFELMKPGRALHSLSQRQSEPAGQPAHGLSFFGGLLPPMRSTTWRPSEEPIIEPRPGDRFALAFRPNGTLLGSRVKPRYSDWDHVPPSWLPPKKPEEKGGKEKKITPAPPFADRRKWTGTNRVCRGEN